MTLDVNGYRALNRIPLLKERFDNWLKEEGIKIDNCKSMEYTPGKLRCTVFTRNELGKRYVDKETGQPATHTTIYYPTTEPPLGVFDEVR